MGLVELKEKQAIKLVLCPSPATGRSPPLPGLSVRTEGMVRKVGYSSNICTRKATTGALILNYCDYDHDHHVCSMKSRWVQYAELPKDPEENSLTCTVTFDLTARTSQGQTPYLS